MTRELEARLRLGEFPDYALDPFRGGPRGDNASAHVLFRQELNGPWAILCMSMDVPADYVYLATADDQVCLDCLGHLERLLSSGDESG